MNTQGTQVVTLSLLGLDATVVSYCGGNSQGGRCLPRHEQALHRHYNLQDAMLVNVFALNVATPEVRG